ncbi:MAG: hypothetical protein QM734_15305 [Cyclobacteriaceae bacterium]
MKSLFTHLLVVSALSVFAQKKDTILLLPGSKDLQTDRLNNYTSSYNLYSVKDGEEKLVGSLDDYLSMNTKTGEALRICKIQFGPNSILDSGLCKLKGLVPIFHRSVQTKKTLNLAFVKNKVTGEIIFKNETGPKSEKIDHESPSPLFDSYYEDIIAKTINLKLGAVFKFGEYIYEKGGTVWSCGEVAKEILA